MSDRASSGGSPLLKRDVRWSREAMSTVMPILHWLPNYDYREMLVKDISCGVTLGCVLIGQSLAHATLSKVDVVHGPYSCILPPLIYAIFGTGNQASVGTGGLLALLTGTALEKVDAEERNHAAGVLCLLVGLLMAGMGIFQLSFLVRFLSRPALSGFVTGSAFLIIKAMIIPMLGLPPASRGHGLLPLLLDPAQFLSCNLVTCALSAGSFFFLFFSKSILPKKIKDLKELFVLAGCGGFCFASGNCFLVELVGDVPTGLPSLRFPLHSLHHFDLARLLLPEAALIALVCFISSFASAKKCGMKEGYQVIAFNELLALGFANIGGAFSGGVPTQIGLSRSALAQQMGVKTPLGANIFVAIVVSCVLLVFGPALCFVPRCCLNAIICNAASGLFEFDQARKLWTFREIRKRKDFLTWIVAFAGTMVCGAFEGILFAVAISLGMAIKQIVNPKMDILGKREQAFPPDITGSARWQNTETYPDARQMPGIAVIRVDGPLFYANSERFQDKVAEMELRAAKCGKPLLAIILSAASIPFVDYTAMEVLSEMLGSFKERNVQFYIAEAYGGARDFFSHALSKKLAQSNVQLSIDACVELVQGRMAATPQKRITSIHSLPVLATCQA